MNKIPRIGPTMQSLTMKVKPGERASLTDAMMAVSKCLDNFLDEVERLEPIKYRLARNVMKFPTNDAAVIQIHHGIYWTPFDGVTVVEDQAFPEVLKFIKKRYPTIKILKFKTNSRLEKALKP